MSNLLTATFKVPGEVVPKARPRFSRVSGKTYTPKKTTDYQNLVRQCYAVQSGVDFGSLPLVCEILAFYVIPKSYSKRKRDRIADRRILHTKRPDVDNLAKSIMDALNKVAYKDDSQIVKLSVAKYYTLEAEPYAWVSLREADSRKM